MCQPKTLLKTAKNVLKLRRSIQLLLFKISVKNTTHQFNISQATNITRYETSLLFPQFFSVALAVFFPIFSISSFRFQSANDIWQWCLLWTGKLCWLYLFQCFQECFRNPFVTKNLNYIEEPEIMLCKYVLRKSFIKWKTWYILKYGTSQNEPKSTKVTRNHSKTPTFTAKPPKSTLCFLKLCWNQPMKYFQERYNSCVFNYNENWDYEQLNNANFNTSYWNLKIMTFCQLGPKK